MNFTINTDNLKEMVGKAVYCVSNNKLIPITSLMSIKVKDGILSLTTTDATNYFYVNSKDKVDCEDFEVSVVADIFAKLIQKTTSEVVMLSVDNNILEVKGNGTYKLELPLENGQPIKFLNKLPKEEPEVSTTIKRTIIDHILNYNKTALAVDLSIPSCCSYYCGDKVITSDRFKVCLTDVNLFDKKLLITPQVMELLSIMSEENINVSFNDEYSIFWTNTDTLYAPITAGVETFPVDALNNLAESDFPSTCKVSRMAVLEMLERLSLFVSSYDKKAITLSFTEEGIMFSSKKSNGTELVPYIESDNFVPYVCPIDIEFFKSQIAVQEGDNIELSYGSDIAIKMKINNVIQIVALIDETEEQ